MNAVVTEQHPPTLDAAQEVRITAMHRGFLYQHLYAVGCLFQAESARVTSVAVERDEDVELLLATRRIYVQVKTRGHAIVPSDIESALERFARIRAEHVEGRRAGDPVFVIVANQPPGPLLSESLDGTGLSADIQFLFPGQPIPAELAALPPAWGNLQEAFGWCLSQAAAVPHAMLAPESLVWKLAGLVMSAATGHMQPGGHSFRVDTLPRLFEQLLVQLQDFPAPLPHYRPQINEPALDAGGRIRLICGFSGAGKTSWVSQATVHATQHCVYFNASETSGATFASSLVREIAAKLLETSADVRRRILLPGASGIDSLRSLDTYLAVQGHAPIVVVDNAHQVAGDHVVAALSATSNLRFLLLCQPGGSTRELEAMLAISRESLHGWDTDTLAAEVVALGARGGAEAMEQLRRQTAGMPLFVHGAARLAVQDYGGDVGQLCEALEQQTNIDETAQDVILARTFDGLTARSRDVVAVLSLADVVLRLDEINQFLSESLDLDAPAVASIVRGLRPLGVVEVFGGQQLKIHDAMRLLGMRHFELMAQDQSRRARSSLKDILYASLTEQREASRFSLFVRTLVALKEVDTITDMANEEMFHEMGLGDIFNSSLEAAAASVEVDPGQRFWALDGLVFERLKAGDLDPIPGYLSSMEQLLDQYHLSDSERMALGMKQMLLKARRRDANGVLQDIENLGILLPNSPTHQRIFKYNAAVALWQLQAKEGAKRLIDEVIRGYCEALGITEQWLLGKSLEQSRLLTSRSANGTGDVKHLADAMEMRAILLKDAGADPGIWRLFAMKLFTLVSAVDSAVRVGQDAADDCVRRRDYDGARDVLRGQVLPLAEHYRLLDRVVSIRSHYAVVLAYCGDFTGAQREMERLAAYSGGFSESQRREIEQQRLLIAGLRARGGPVRARLPGQPPALEFGGQRDYEGKVGRNDPCPCGSGRKFKRCHG